MTAYLLDTNVLSEVLRKRPTPSVIARLRGVDSTSLYTSAVCIMELRFGAERHPARPALWNRIRGEVLPLVRVLPVGVDEAVRAGQLLAALQASGRPIGTEDVLIAATALEHNLTVVTRNVRHLGRVTGVLIEDWWE